ncbi:MAG TPA: DUF2520 domain-containing protein [Chloroflexota bacterium]|nr:DUF2520 domain-containing protein [Chloroflexota bacterium]
MPRIGFVGAGRLASVLAVKLAEAGYAVTGITSQRASSAKRLAELLSGCAVLDSAQAIAAAADLMFITVPDDAIAGVAASVPWRAGLAAVHCSGALDLEVLAPAGQRGGFHPLQTFATGETELAGVSVAIEASGELLATLESMAIKLGCLPFRLPAGGRPLYHASGVFGHNYIVTLLAQAVRLWGLLGYSEAQALQALLPLAKTSLINLEHLGVARALTGPIARGDGGTIRRHLQALEANAPDLLPMYRELGSKSLELTQLEPAVAAEVEAILSNPKESQPCV